MLRSLSILIVIGMQMSAVAAYAADRTPSENPSAPYSEGRSAEARGDLGAAIAAYLNASDRHDAASPYALMRVALLARQIGDPLLEQVVQTRLLLQYPDSLAAKAVRRMAAESALSLGDGTAAVQMLWSQTVSNDASNERYRREDQALLAEAFLAAGDSGSARAAAERLIVDPRFVAAPDDAALDAVRVLDVIDTPAGSKKPQFSDASEHMRRASIYQSAREFVSARTHYEEVVLGSDVPDTAAEAAFQIGRGYAQAGEYVVALQWFERVTERWPETPAARDALLQKAAAFARVGKMKESIGRYKQFIDRYPNDEKIDRAFLNACDVERDAGQDQDALRWAAKGREALRGKPQEGLAVYAEAKVHIARGEWNEAIQSLEQLLTLPDVSSFPGGASRSEIELLIAYCLEQGARYDEAIRRYLSIPDGRLEYFGWLANRRLEELRQNEAARPELARTAAAAAQRLSSGKTEERAGAARELVRVSDTPELLARSREILLDEGKRLTQALSRELRASAGPKVPTAEFLTRIGAYEEAAAETDAASVSAIVTAAAYQKAGRADRTIAAAEPMWRKIDARIPIEGLPVQELEWLFPVAYRDHVVSAASRFGVDARLILSIMRQESRFQPDARSGAAARGVMQFIPSTSRRIARLLEIEGFDDDALYHPPTAITFGARYLAELNELFPSKTEAVVAAYNGGEDNVKRWAARARSNEAERAFAEIVYSQTKEYTVRVMANYRMYQYLYNEDLSRR